MENTDSKELDQVDEVNNDEDQIRDEEAIDAVQVKLDADEVDGVDDESAVTINGDVNHNNDTESMPPPQAQSATAQHGDGLGEDQSGAGGKELEIDVNIHDESVMGDDPSLYDDVMMGSAAAKIESRDGESEDKSSSPSATGGSSGSQENGGSNGLQRATTNQGPNNANSHSSYGGHQQKRVCCYVGNLTWWTNDKDLSDAIASLQVTDLIDIKFYENKVNGQSKGFALVTVGSDASFRALMDKLPKCKLHGREPIVTHFSRHFFAQFEEQARKDFPSSAGSGSSGGGGNDHYQQQQQPSYGNNPNQQQQFFMNQRNRGNFGNGGGMNGNGAMSTGLPLSRPQQGGGGNMASNGPMMSGPRGQQQGYMNGNGPGLVGPYPQNRMNGPQQGAQASQQQQSSLLGNTPPGMMPIRPGLASNSAQFAAGNRAPNGMMMPQQQQGPQVGNQQTSLLGNRPGGGGGMIAQSNVPAANVASQGPGLLPMRPGMTPIGAPNASQAPGLLNNPPGMPRMPQPQQPVNPQNAWDNRGNPVVGANGAMMPNAGMMAQMNPAVANQQRVNQINPAAAAQYGMATPHHQYVTPQGPNPAAAMNTMNGGLIGAPPGQQHLYHQHHHPHQAQQQQTQSQPIPGHYATPYGQQPGVGVGIPQSASMHMQPQQQQIHQHHPVMTMTGGVDPSQQYHRQTSAGSVGLKMMPEMETIDALEKNRIITSQAISRAVHDSSIGQFASAIETLVMAISLIKQSKIANDERCKILVASLEDTKQAIEEKYYASLNMLQQQQQQQQQQPQRSYGREDSRERSSPSAPPSSRGGRGGGGGGYERSRSRSRDSRDRDRDRDSGSSKEHRHHHRRGGGGSDKHHHRSSHRDRDRGRSRSRSRGDRRIVSVDRDDAYYDDAKYHRSSRH